MAISIEKPIPKLLSFGISDVKATYWKVTEIWGDYMKRVASVKLAGFVSQEARIAGLEPIDFKQITFVDNDFILDSAQLVSLNTNPVTLAYEKIKTLPEFQGALDV